MIRIMFSDSPCQIRKVKAGVVAETLTGTSRERNICDVGKATDIKHFASVKNLRIYESRVTCTATIPEPRFLHFLWPTPDNRAYVWSRRVTLKDYGKYNFPPVPIRSDSPGGGDQIIEVVMKVDRLRARGTLESVSVSITVSA